jgi:hypothetical protein
MEMCESSDDHSLQGQNRPAAFSCGTKPASSTLQSAPVRGTHSRKHNHIEDARLEKAPMAGGYDMPHHQILFDVDNKVTLTNCITLQ